MVTTPLIFGDIIEFQVLAVVEKNKRILNQRIKDVISYFKKIYGIFIETYEI